MTTNLSRLFQKASLAGNATKTWTNKASQLGPHKSHYAAPPPLPLVGFSTPQDLNNIVLASDSDVGGSSRIDVSIAEADQAGGSWEMQGLSHGIVKGRISLAVREEVHGKVRGGYVGFRTKPQPGVFSTTVVDLSRHTHLSIICRPGGDPRLWPHWFVNVQTDGFIEKDLWSHRLGLTGRGQLGDGWEECQIPLTSLVHLHLGRISDNQIEPDLSKMKTIGLSLLGAPRADPNRATPEDAYRFRKTPEGVEGHFELRVGRIEGIYKDPHFVNFLPPTYSAPPSTLHFLPPPPPEPTRYPTFAEANYKPTQLPTYTQGNYPPYEPAPEAIEDARGHRKTITDGNEAGVAGRRKRALGLDNQQTAKQLDEELNHL